MITWISVFSIPGNAQDDEQCVNRKPVVAGQFYPSDATQLHATLEELFEKAETKRTNEHVSAIIVPHAGFVYSGKVAASSYNQIEPDRQFDNIFILASSHRKQFSGASIYHIGNYETPLGTVRVNRDLAKKLTDEHEIFQFNQDAHQQEHSLEVQLPFLQHHLKREFQIIPIVTGTHNPADCKKIGEALEPYFNQNNLFVISTDFSHYPNYSDANKIDKITAHAVIQNSPGLLLQTIRENAKKNVTNLVTSMCGWPATLSFLYISEKQHNIKVEKIDYQNSGDILESKDRVVGYWSIAFYKNIKQTNNMSFQLKENEKDILLKIARETIESFIRNGKIPRIDKSELTETLKQPAGAFVTLHKSGELRGCIGRFKPENPLYKIVQDMAIAASTQDFRFPPLKEEELKDIEIEISVLTPMERINSINDIELGVHGIYIKKGARAGTLLPQVVEKTGWSKEEFLGYCARDKAGLDYDAWKEKDTEVYTYRAIVFNERKRKE